MKQLLIIILVLSSLATTAQQTDKVLGKLYYTFRHMTDTAQPTVFREENMALYIGANITSYFSLDQFKKDSLRVIQQEQGGGMVIDTRGRKTNNTRILFDKSQQKMVVSEVLIKRYYYEDIYPAIQWRITDDVKEIGGLKCTRAEGEFKGRTYYAWFTTAVALSGAPWKLAGLPGLVMEAYDSKKQVYFLFAGMENNKDTALTISTVPAEGIKTTKADLAKMREAALNDPVGFINNAAADAGSGLRMTSTGGGGSFKPKKPVNPVELKD